MPFNSQIELTVAEVEILKAASLPVDCEWRKRMENACNSVLEARGIKGFASEVDIDYLDRDTAIYTLKFWAR